VTARDGLVLDLDLSVLKDRIDDFRNPKFSDSEIRTRFDLAENYMWRVTDARKQLMKVKNCDQLYTEVLYRPFNTRHIFFHPSVVWRPRLDVMRQMQKPNVALITTRQTRDPFGALATRLIVGHKSVAAYDINSVFPLYVYLESREQRGLPSSGERTHNLAPEFLRKMASTLGISQNGAQGLPDRLTAEDIFNYAYAVLYSPGYRRRYAEFLKMEFPRLPLTGNLELFRALAKLGGQLAALHLLESPKLDKARTEFVGGRNPEVEKISYSKNTVWIDKVQTVGFRGVPEEVWSFHIGGYQVCEKWLKDRKGRTLSKGDIAHYHKIVIALHETIRLMSEIDKIIEQHGGWPGAFAVKTESKEQ
jgi:predicted helicase